MDKERWTTLPRLGGTLKHPPLHLSETGRFVQAFKSRTLLQKSTSTLPFSHNADYETFTRITISQFDLVSSTSTFTAAHWAKHNLFSSLIITLKSLFFHYFGLAHAFTHLCNLSTNKIRLSDLLQGSNARCRNSLIGGPHVTCVWRYIVWENSNYSRSGMIWEGSSRTPDILAGMRQ